MSFKLYPFKSRNQWILLRMDDFKKLLISALLVDKHFEELFDNFSRVPLVEFFDGLSTNDFNSSWLWARRVKRTWLLVAWKFDNFLLSKPWFLITVSTLILSKILEQIRPSLKRTKICWSLGFSIVKIKVVRVSALYASNCLADVVLEWLPSIFHRYHREI